MKTTCWKYEVNNDLRIIGYAEVYVEEFPEWADAPAPSIEMIKPGWQFDEYGNPLYRWDGEKPVLDPIIPDIEIKEAKRIKKVKTKFNTELSDIIYNNKDNHSQLSKVLCDRMKEINLTTT